MILVAIALSVLICAGGVCAAPVVIDEGAATPRDERQVHAAWVGFRPADGQTCHVNPPRFSWPYNPGTVVPSDHKAEHTFTLQISRRADMSQLAVNVEATPYNFYNALPVLEGSYHWFWRVGYDVGTERERWTRLRTFAIAQDAIGWDRTILADLAPHLQSHPRIIFTPENLAELRGLKDRDEESARIYEACLQNADAVTKKPWFKDMPEADPIGGEYDCVAFRDMARDLQVMALAYMLSGDEKYLACKGPLLTLASYPPGGASSPEGLGESRKWATKVTMHMGLCFDWLYPVLSEAEREQIAASLEFRIEHIWENFSWYRRGSPNVRGLAMFVASHQAQNFYWTLTGSLALYERSQVARDFVEMGLNYLVGVTSGFGPEEAWNEGLSYGNGKCATLLDATLYALMTIPELHLERNPFYRRIGTFFSYLSPVGMERSAWGNYGGTAQTHLSTHQRNHRRFAFLTGDRTFLENWRACREVQGRTVFEWQEYGLPHYFAPTEPALESENALLCNLAGWAMAFSGPPSDPATYTDGVGITFHCRPRGGYSHSFQSENAFELFAYGSVIATGGGRKTNGDRHAAATMSHNSVLIDGRGQRFTQFEPDPPTAGRIIAWHTAPGLVYWCGDATAAYARTVPYLRRFLRHVLFVDDQFFVIFDDLETAADHDPATFSWLYHVHHDVPVELDTRQATFSYQVREANVVVQHLLGADSLELLNLRGEDGYKNPITGEDMLAAARKSVESSPLRKWSGRPMMNNIWVTTKAPSREAHFLAVVLPWREGSQQPSVTPMGERRLAIEVGGKRRTIGFGAPGDVQADIVVDYERVRMLGGDPAAPAAAANAWRANLSDTTGWKLDGEGSVTHEPDAGSGVLRIATKTRTVYWANQIVEAPALIDFEVRTENPKTRAILFFMAEGMDGEDIFTWDRPVADYGDYAYAERMRLYTVGLMREGCGTESNFRFLGEKLAEHLRILQTPADQLSEEQRAVHRKATQDFQPYSIPSSTCDGYELGTWMRYQVVVDGHLIRVFGNGRLLHEIVDSKPLRRGRFGFRNFRAETTIEVRNLSVTSLRGTD